MITTSTYTLAMIVGFKICWMYHLLRNKTLSKRERIPVYETKMILIVKLLFWGFGKSRVSPHWHYSLVHFDLESYLRVNDIGLEIIRIQYDREQKKFLTITKM